MAARKANVDRILMFDMKHKAGKVFKVLTMLCASVEIDSSERELV